jgi:hypothetical protein
LVEFELVLNDFLKPQDHVFLKVLDTAGVELFGKLLALAGGAGDVEQSRHPSRNSVFLVEQERKLNGEDENHRVPRE